MTYCTEQDLVDRFSESELVQLTDRDNNDVIDNEALDSAIQDVASETNSYIGQRYTLPLPSVPSVLTRHACNMVLFVLYNPLTEEVGKQHKLAMDFLKNVSHGRVLLPGISTAGKSSGKMQTTQACSNISWDKY